MLVLVVFLSSCCKLCYEKEVIYSNSFLKTSSACTSKMESTFSGNSPTRSICALLLSFWAGLLGQVGGDGVPALSTKARVSVLGGGVLLSGILFFRKKEQEVSISPLLFVPFNFSYYSFN